MTSSAIAPAHEFFSPPQTWPATAPWALFLDLDGTLCAYCDNPAEVMFTAAQRALLRRLQRSLGGALCVLSGRSATDLKRIFGDLVIAYSAEHGGAAESRDAALMSQLAQVEADLRDLSLKHPGSWVERKPSSCVLHYRRLPHRAMCIAADLPALDSARDRLRRLDGLGVFEFAARDYDKGTALRAQMQQAPFSGRIPVAVGDDVTDEDAFAAATALGGFGIAVGPRASTHARFHLADTTAVAQWLEQLAGGSDAMD